MENTRQIATIDLGSKKLGIALAHIGDSGKVAVDFYEEFPSDGIRSGKVLNPTKLGAALRLALGKVAEGTGKKIVDAMVNTQKCDIRHLQKKIIMEISEEAPISEETLSLLADNASEELRAGLEQGDSILSLCEQAFNTAEEINVSCSDIIGMMSPSVEGMYTAFIGKASLEKYIDTAFADAGILTARKIFVPEQVGRSILTDSEMASGVGLVDFGSEATGISIFLGGVLRHYGAIPFGVSSVVGDISNLCNIPPSLAENIFKSHGGVLPDKLGSLGDKTLRIHDVVTSDKTEIPVRYLSEIITARTREIIEAVLYDIQQSGYADSLKSGIVIVGGGAEILNICDQFKLLSGYSTRIGAPSKLIFEAADTTPFFSPKAAATAGLLYRFSSLDKISCTEEAPDIVSQQAVDEILGLESVTPGEGDVLEYRQEPSAKPTSVDEDKAKPEKPAAEEKNGVFSGLFNGWRNAAKAGRESKEDKKKQEKPEAEAEEAKKPETVKKPKKISKPKEEGWGRLFFDDDDDPDNQI